MRPRRSVLVPSLMLVGATVGVGIFSVPTTLSTLGPWLALAMCVGVGGLVLVLQLLCMEVALATPEQARLSGFVRHWLGERWKWVAAVGTVGSSWGALVAYVLVGGAFAQTLAALAGSAAGPTWAWQLGWGCVAALAVALGLRSLARLDAVITGGLVVVAALAIGVAAGRADVASVLHAPSGGAAAAALAYGVLLFSLAGPPAVPPMEELVGGNRAAYRRSIVIGTVVAWLLTVGFGFAVWAALGAVGVEGLPAAFGRAFGAPAAALLALFGFLGVCTGYLAVASNLRDSLAVDLRVPPRAAWAMTALVPIAIALLGHGDVLRVIGWTGAVFGGLSSILLCVVFLAIQRKRRTVRLPGWMAVLVLACVVAGAVAELGREALMGK